MKMFLGGVGLLGTTDIITVGSLAFLSTFSPENYVYK